MVAGIMDALVAQLGDEVQDVDEGEQKSIVLITPGVSEARASKIVGPRLQQMVMGKYRDVRHLLPTIFYGRPRYAGSKGDRPRYHDSWTRL